MIEKVLEEGLPKNTLLNINIPDFRKGINGIRITILGKEFTQRLFKRTTTLGEKSIIGWPVKFRKLTMTKEQILFQSKKVTFRLLPFILTLQTMWQLRN